MNYNSVYECWSLLCWISSSLSTGWWIGAQMLFSETDEWNQVENTFPTEYSQFGIWFLIPDLTNHWHSLGRGSLWEGSSLRLLLLVPLLLYSSPSLHLSIPFAVFSHFSPSPSHLSSPSSSVPILPLSRSISIATFISLALCLFYFSLKKYIQDAGKCNGPLAGSPLQLGLGRHICINPPGLFLFAFSPHGAGGC